MRKLDHIVGSDKKVRRHEETEAQATVLTGLRYLGFLAWRNQKGIIPIWAGTGQTRRVIATRKNRESEYTNGLPDIFVILKPDGMLLGIEMKSTTGKLSTDQETWRDRFFHNGAEYLVATSWDEVLRFLQSKGYASNGSPAMRLRSM
jgi:hypothetical protein